MRTFFALQQQQNLGRRFGASNMHLSSTVAQGAVRSKAVVLWDCVIVLCFVVRYFVSILVLQSS